MDEAFQKIIRVGFCLLFIFVPLILTPWNYELFEFNKMLAVYTLTTVIVAAWLGRMIRQRRIIFKRTPFDLPLLSILISQSLSLLFSIDRHTSFWGYYSRFHGGLLSTICYLLLYWAFVSNMTRRYTLDAICCSLFTAFIVSLYGILEHFGIDAHLWIQDVKNRVFSTLGQPNWLAAYLAILIPITLGFALSSKFNFLLYLCLYLLLVLCFFYTKSQSGLLGLGVSLAVFWTIIFFKTFKDKFFKPAEVLTKWGIFNFSFLILFLSVGLTAFPEIYGRFEKIGLIKRPEVRTEVSSQIPAYQPPALEVGGTASGEIRKIVWKGAMEIFKHYPLFGSGVETFAYSYYNFRPVEHNLVSEWDFLYNKAHNEYLNFLATTGIIGLGTYLIFIGSFIFWCLNKLKAQSVKLKTTTQNLKLKDGNTENFALCTLHFALFSGWLSILITNFFGFSVVPVALFFFLIPAFCIVLTEQVISHQSSVISIKNFSTTQKFLLIILLIAESWLLLTVVKLWRADYHYSQGEKLNKTGQHIIAFQNLIKAAELNAGEPVYRNEIAESAGSLALFAFQQKDATAASKFAQIALSQSEQALKVSPRNLNFWKGRVKVLYNLAKINKDFAPVVIEVLQQAISLAPTDPKLKYNLGIIYGSFDQVDLAIESFKNSIELKPNYKDSRYALALYLKETGKNQEAKEQLEYILKNISPDDSPSAGLLEEISK